ncbi:minor capsid protein [Ligilactobacillus equi]|uniref:minor capsid protein n=1 Tax=Ligilactobacillus equi TaxID=137357 RepID=UPI001377E3FA|nr:minor capsid protein [Ligilactobacillus equi]
MRNIKSDEEMNAKLKIYYDKAQREIQSEIDSQLARLADKNGIDITEVRGVVSKADIRSLEAYAKSVVVKANKMRKELGRGLTEKDFSKEVNDRMRLYNATMRINRLELLKSSIGMHLVELGLDVNSELKNYLKEEYTIEFKRQAGIMADDLPKISPTVMKEAYKTVMATTGGVEFSKRVWQNMDLMKAELDNQLVKGLTQGTNPRKMAQNLRKYVSDSFEKVTYATERITRTESSRVHKDAFLRQLRKYGYKFVKWHAEPSACKICREIVENDDGFGPGVFRVDDLPSIPAHPNCKCTLSAYWVD